MGAYIKFGDYNKNYKYIIITCIFNYLSYYVSDGVLNGDIPSEIINPDSGDYILIFLLMIFLII